MNPSTVQVIHPTGREIPMRPEHSKCEDKLDACERKPGCSNQTQLLRMQEEMENLIESR